MPPKSGRRTLSPTATVGGIKEPSFVVIPGPTASTDPSFDLLIWDSGSRIPPAVWSEGLEKKVGISMATLSGFLHLCSSYHTLYQYTVCERNEFLHQRHLNCVISFSQKVGEPVSRTSIVLEEGYSYFAVL